MKLLQARRLYLLEDALEQIKALQSRLPGAPPSGQAPVQKAARSARCRARSEARAKQHGGERADGFIQSRAVRSGACASIARACCFGGA